MLVRIWSLVTKELIHLRRDVWMPAFMLIGGIMELLLIGWATSRPITNIPLIVIDYDKSSQSRELVESIENMATFSAPRWEYDLDVIGDAFEHNQAIMALVIPEDFGADLIRARVPELMVVLNGAESVSAMAAKRAIEGLAADMGLRITLERIGLAEEDLFGNISVRVWFNEELTEAHYTVPAEMALMLEFTVLIFAALSFARERELGTLEQLLVKPLSRLEIIIGKSIPTFLVGMVDFAAMLAIVHLAFAIPVRGSLPLLIMLASGYVLVELSKGLMISVFSRTQHQALLLVIVIGMADFMFTGYAVPVESMPPVLQFMGNFVPAHHWLAIVRGIMLKGVGLEVLWPNVLALAVLGLFLGGVSLTYIRRTLT